MSDVYAILNGQRFAVQRNWLGASEDLRGISSVTVLSTGQVAALFRGSPQVRIYDVQGRQNAAWQVPGLVCPHHIKAAPDGGVIVTDLDGHRVLGLDAQGKIVWSLGAADQPVWMAPFNHPTDAALDSQGRLYVTDGYGNFCFHRFDAQRQLIQTHGSAGAQAGQFSTPHAVVVGDDKVYIADRENSRVQIFDTQGQFQDQITTMYKPMALALTADQHLLVSDQTAALTLFDHAGQALGRCRVQGVYGHGLAVGPDGAIYISEMIPDALTRLLPLDT